MPSQVNTPDGLPDLLTGRWIVTVLKTPDNELRAHRIALTYSALAIRLDDWLKGHASVNNTLKREGLVPDACDANWFHFATWGTLTVTQNIGTARVPQRLNAGLGLTVRRRLAPVALRARAADGQRIGRALAWGQRLIFASVCCGMYWLFHQEDEQHPVDAPGDVFDQFIAAINTEIKPPLDVARMRTVKKAFMWYVLAKQSTDAATRRQLILGANVLLTAVEQDLVDRAINVVVNLTPHLVAEQLDWRFAQLANRMRGVPTELSMLYQSFRHVGPRTFVDTAWSRLMTDQVLVMALPTEILRLGRDVPPREKGKPFCARELRDLTAPVPSGDGPPETKAALTDVVELIDSLDRTTVDGEGSAARDWRRWDERMNWAVALMRSRQDDRTLFWPPYSLMDRRRVYRGDLPRRAADPSSLEVNPPLDDEVPRYLPSVPGFVP